MKDFSDINEKYNNFFPCLLSIESKKNFFKMNNHNLIFSFLLGYFTNKNMILNDLNNIYNQYKQKVFNKSEFSKDFKNIAYMFCEYFQKKEDPKIFSNNINNINNSGFKPNNPNANNNNEINNSHLGNTNYNIFNDEISNSKSNNKFNILNNSNNNNKINFLDINEIENNYPCKDNNYINSDYDYAKALEIQEKEDLEKLMKEDQKSQTKKCEICLEEFSLLDITNYFLNCNCVLHNTCFDNMVKSAVESNNLPIKCPNCKIPIHPNFIEDSLRNANPQLIDKYEHFSLNNFLMNNNDEYSSCPTPGCEYMFFFNPGEHHFLCPMCNKNYCLNCKVEWHNGMTCQEYKDSRDVNKLDDKFYQFVKGAKFKMCPRCKYWVEKNQGCNHMKCRCGADFCYKCGKLMDMSRAHRCN